MFQIKRALLSCTDKTGLAEFARFLADRKVEILSTGGTAKLLRDHHIPVTEVSDHTGSPEILDGRVKTLHPKIHGGILAIRDNETHQKQMIENQIEPIDLVVINLYAFEKTIHDPYPLGHKRSTIHDAIENIDIGGPALMRSAAKNHADVAVVTDPADYEKIMRELEETGTLSRTFRFELACKVFARTAQYDSVISSYLNQFRIQSGPVSGENFFPDRLSLDLQKVNTLRYGENPHQQAALYRETGQKGIVDAKQWQGKELSFNNYMDMESAWSCVSEFKEPACVIVKHMNPCGVAQCDHLNTAFIKARQGDPVSSFGGVVALNRVVDKPTALLLAETFFEVIIAPDYETSALEVFSKKKNLRLMSCEEFSRGQFQHMDYRRLSGGLLVQQADAGSLDLSACQVVTKRKPTPEEYLDLDFAWKVVKHVKSNAIVFAKNGQILGVGAGQMSRVDSVKLAVSKALGDEGPFDSLRSLRAGGGTRDEGRGATLEGAVLASDAFFPFRDGVDIAANQGITAIVQPGGSVRDQEVIAACDEHGIAMIFTGMRHFRH